MLMQQVGPQRPVETLPASSGQAAGSRFRRPGHATWPLTLLLVGFPVWWLLGLSSLLPLLLAVPMAVQLLRNRPVRLPRGIGWWLLFLLWVCFSMFTLWADAPSAVSGGGPERLWVFGYRLLWYVAATIGLLWIGNADERDVPTLRVIRLLGWMFVVTVAGGLFGIVAPTFELTSLVEALLPSSLSSNSFVQLLVHPTAATLTTFLGREEYRPIAPFAFANTWGSNLSMYLPFFLLGWFGKGAGWRKVVGVVVLPASVFPIVYSMNRGLWVSLALGAGCVVVYLLLKGRRAVLLLVLVGATVALAVFLNSPLAAQSSDTIDSAHSNDRRGALLVQTVESTVQGSPVIGFGSTRDVQGSFSSMAGGATAECQACAVPPLGTQGQLWLVIFSQGLVGTLFFLVFFVVRFRVHWRSRSVLEFAGVVILLFFAVQIFIYDTLSMPFYTVMLTLGLLWRERQRIAGVPATSTDLRAVLAPVRRSLPAVLVATVTGAAVGTAYVALQPNLYEARVTLLLAPSPVYLYSDGSENLRARETTVDTEAALVMSGPSLQRLATGVGLPDGEAVRSRTSITAAATTRVIKIAYTDQDPGRAARVANGLADAYLSVRGQYLAQRRDRVLLALSTQLRDLANQNNQATTVQPPVSGMNQVPVAPPENETAVRREFDRLSLNPVTAGEVLRPAETTAVSAQPEVGSVSLALLGFLAVLGISLARTRHRAPVHGRHTSDPPLARPRRPGPPARRHSTRTREADMSHSPSEPLGEA